MGTRNLTCVVKDGVFKVAQYCQWDGQPEGQGAEIVRFLTDEKFDLERFKNKINTVKQISSDEVNALWKVHSHEFKKLYPNLTRDYGAEILNFIYHTGNPVVFVETEFASDSLFCEWAYVIDLDKDTLEVYKGFNKLKLTSLDRFFFLQTEGTEYYPVLMVDRVSISDLSSNYIEELVKKLQGA